MICLGKITKIDTESSKKIHVELRLDKVLAICYDGENLIDPEHSNNPPNLNYVDYFRSFYTNLYRFKISGCIKKHDVRNAIFNYKIYDNKLHHLNDDCETNLKENNLITLLIKKNKLLDEEDSENEIDAKRKIKRNEFLQFSIKNSLIKNAKQFYISEHDSLLNIPYMLGINYDTCTNNWLANTTKMDRDCCVMNESILNNLKVDSELTEFGSLIDKNLFRINGNSGFSFEK